jgi:hypothetical protein
MLELRFTRSNAMIAIAGGLLALLGIVSAALLGAASLGLVAIVPGLSLWILFPLLTLLGWFLLVVSDVNPARGFATKAVALPLLVLALLCVLGLVATGAGLLPLNGVVGTGPLWYVAIVGGFLGALGTAAYGRRARPPQVS